MVTEEEVLKAIEDVVDPETQITVMEMNLIDGIELKPDGIVKVKFHATTPLCPPQYAYSMALDMKDRISSIEGVKKVAVVLIDHYLSPEINQAVNGPDWKPEGPDEAGPAGGQEGEGTNARRSRGSAERTQEEKR